jgi:hypothetical protein|tara:strand:+ start:327 stop:593 length:267 start_codon:yes stop_codon:yes gene_type:complete
MKLYKIETYCISELKGNELYNALTWLDEFPIETENNDGKMRLEYCSDHWNNGYEDEVTEHCEINDYLFAYDGTPIHRFIKENHKTQLT